MQSKCGSLFHGVHLIWLIEPPMMAMIAASPVGCELGAAAYELLGCGKAAKGSVPKLGGMLKFGG